LHFEIHILREGLRNLTENINSNNRCYNDKKTLSIASKGHFSHLVHHIAKT